MASNGEATPLSRTQTEANSETITKEDTAECSHRAVGEPNTSSDADPFTHLRIASHQPLTRCVRRKCPAGCGKQRRYYCSECLVPLLNDGDSFPVVPLPLHVHVLQSGAERPQQSTAQHIGLLAAGDSTIWRPFPECMASFESRVMNAIEGEDSAESTIAVLYPCEDALSPEQAAKQLPKLKHLIVLDATWTKSAVMVGQLEREHRSWFAKIPKVTLPPHARSAFWRYAPLRSEHSQYFSPDKVPSLVSTVEAVHQFCTAFGRARDRQDVDVKMEAEAAEGKHDNLLWLFAFMHRRVRQVYEEFPGKRERIIRKSKGVLSQF